MSEVTIKISGGGSFTSLEAAIDAAQVTQGDLLYAAQNQRSRILQRTERGVDVDGAPFAPYNSTRPFYWYPAGRVRKVRASHSDLKKEKANVKRAAKSLGGRVSRSGLGVRFASYADFKSRGLGRSGVDLRGPRAPHMLQEIAVKAGGTTITGKETRTIGLNDYRQPLNNGVIGIYGDAAKRASGHNSDDRPRGMPKRRFMGVSEADTQKFAGDLQSRAGERAKRALAGQR